MQKQILGYIDKYLVTNINIEKDTVQNTSNIHA